MGHHFRDISGRDRDLDHVLPELQIGQDLFDVTIRVTYRNSVEWSVEILSAVPSYDLSGPMPMPADIEVSLDRAGPSHAIQRIVDQALFDEDLEYGRVDLSGRRIMKG